MAEVASSDRTRWQETVLNIPTTGGDREERAIVHIGAPGLAITMHQFGSFDVTHMASGKKVFGPYLRCGMAMLIAAEAARCVDWTKDAAGIAAEIRERGSEPVPFPGHTSTSGGVEHPITIQEFMESSRNWMVGDEFPWEGPDEDPAQRAWKLLNQPAAAA